MKAAQIKARAVFILNDLTNITERLHDLANEAESAGDRKLMDMLDTLASEIQDAAHKAHKEHRTK